MTKLVKKHNFLVVNDDGTPLLDAENKPIVKYRTVQEDLTYSSDGSSAGLVIVDGQLSGTLITQTQAITDAATVQRLTFDPPINGATFNVRPTAAADDTLDDGVLIVVGNHTPAVAAVWLDEANTAPRFSVKPSDGDVSKAFSSEVSYVDIIGVGTAPTVTVTVGGVR